MRLSRWCKPMWNHLLLVWLFFGCGSALPLLWLFFGDVGAPSFFPVPTPIYDTVDLLSLGFGLAQVLVPALVRFSGRGLRSSGLLAHDRSAVVSQQQRRYR
jgi:hypothetical protein